jgi:hypothetical protein
MTKAIETEKPPVEMLDAGDARPWPVKVLTLLFFVQALGLIGLAVFNFDQAVISEETIFLQILLSILTSLNQTLAFGTLSLLAIVAGFGFLWLWKTGWLTGIMLQGLLLLVAIGLYLRGGPIYVFGLMSYSILMIIYLHHPEVQQAFQTKQTQQQKMEEAE